MGELLSVKGEWDEAAVCFQKAIDLQGINSHLWFYRNLGEALMARSSS